MSEAHKQRKWVREEVAILVAEYFRIKKFSKAQLSVVYQEISDFLFFCEEVITGLPVSDVFRNYTGIYMQSERIRCLDPDTEHFGMQGTKLQKEIVQEYLASPQKIMEEAEQIYKKYKG